MKFSVVTPVYNAEKYIGTCIDSILNQSYQDFELILVNDGSRDNSLSILRKYEELDPRIKVIDCINSGVSKARNTGIEKCTGEWVIFVDADDTLSLEALTEISNSILNHDDAEIVYYSYCEEKENEINRFNLDGSCRKTALNEMYQKLFDDLRFNGYVWNKAFKVDLIRRYGITFDMNIALCEDMLFCFNYLRHCSNGLLLEKDLYVYKKHTDSVTKNTVQDKHISAFSAFDQILNECDNNECEMLARAAYIKMIIFMSKKTLQFGCRSVSIRNKLKESLLKQLTLDYSPLRKKPKRWIFIFRHFPIVYKFMRIR